MTLQGAQLRQLLIDTAATEGRVKLLNPREAFAKAGIKAAFTSAALHSPPAQV